MAPPTVGLWPSPLLPPLGLVRCSGSLWAWVAAGLGRCWPDVDARWRRHRHARGRSDTLAHRRADRLRHADAQTHRHADTQTHANAREHTRARPRIQGKIEPYYRGGWGGGLPGCELRSYIYIYIYIHFSNSFSARGSNLLGGGLIYDFAQNPNMGFSFDYSNGSSFILRRRPFSES